ncbi:MAG: hypothetical protein JXX28_16050 [Deltaproteobacteria bacterium]|nr:hypothetical protein [Deltaproteobacteria bacterium]
MSSVTPRLPLLSFAQLLLVAGGAVMAMGVPALGAPLLLPLWFDPLGGRWEAALLALLLLGVGALSLLGSLGIAAALLLRRPWSWRLGLVGGAVLLPTALGPVAVLLLVALLRPEARAAYGVGAASTGAPEA